MVRRDSKTTSILLQLDLLARHKISVSPAFSRCLSTLVKRVLLLSLLELTLVMFSLLALISIVLLSLLPISLSYCAYYPSHVHPASILLWKKNRSEESRGQAEVRKIGHHVLQPLTRFARCMPT
jgi:hypothetical protein